MDPEYLGSFRSLEMTMMMVGMRVFDSGDTLTKWQWLRKNWFFAVTMLQLSLTVVLEGLRFGSGMSFLMKTEQFACISFCFIALTKMGATSLNSKRMRNLFEEVEKIWPKGDVPEEVLEIKRRSLARLKKVSIVYITWNWIFMTIFNSGPIIEALLDLIMGEKCRIFQPYLIWSPFDLNRPVWFEISYIYFMWSGYIASLGVTSQDCLFQTSCSHIAMLLETLQYELTNIVPNDYFYTSENADESALIKRLGEIVKKHQKLIELAEILEDVYTVVNMINVVCVSFIICLVGFQSTVADTKKLVKYVISTGNQISQALVLSWHGNLLIEKSESLGLAAYRCKWYNAGPHFKSNLYFVMMRASKPVSVTAMKFSKISLQTFTSIARSSWSYFTLLKTVYNP